MSEYQKHDMCPFTVAKIGGGGTVAGFGGESYTCTHSPCIRDLCRLWVVKKVAKGDETYYTEGCALQFLGLSAEEIDVNEQIRGTR